MSYKKWMLIYIISVFVLSTIIKINAKHFDNYSNLLQQLLFCFFSYGFWIVLCSVILVWNFIPVQKDWIFKFPAILFLLAYALDNFLGFKEVKGPYILNFSALELWNFPGMIFIGFLTK